MNLKDYFRQRDNLRGLIKSSLTSVELMQEIDNELEKIENKITYIVNNNIIERKDL